VTEERAARIGLAAVLALAALLSLWNLGSAYLWQDEAQTALLARTILDHGLPLGFDGRNHFSQDQGLEYGPGYLWRWHNWLPLYVLAFCFELFGQHTAVARLPFALFGVATVALVWLLGRELWRDHRAALAGATLLSLSVPFLLLARQCRYYAPTAFFVLLCLLAYRRFLRRAPHGAPLLVLAGVLLFHTHYLHCAILLAALLAHAALWWRQRFFALAASCAVVVLIVAPWLLWTGGTGHFEQYGGEAFDLPRSLRFGGIYLGMLARHVFPPWLLLVPVALVGFDKLRGDPLRRPAWEPLSCLLLYVAVCVVAFAGLSPLPFFRFLTPLLPLLCLIAGSIVAASWRRQWLLGTLVLAALVVRGPLRDFGYELTHDFRGPIEAIVEHLEENAEVDDVVAITYGDLPLKFYTGLRVIGGLTGEDLRPALEADWIILRRHTRSPVEKAALRYLLGNVDWDRYRKITLTSVDTAWENRAEPREHRFRTAERGKPVVIFQRSKEPTDAP
jgi:4-amino-4-deoxy-L-arabinose transferase-like glycosyltransferase